MIKYCFFFNNEFCCYFFKVVVGVIVGFVFSGLLGIFVLNVVVSGIKGKIIEVGIVYLFLIGFDLMILSGVLLFVVNLYIFEGLVDLYFVICEFYFVLVVKELE